MLYNSLLLHLRTPQYRAHKYKYHIADKYCPALAYKYSGAQLWALDPRGCYTNLKRDGQRGEMMGMGGRAKLKRRFTASLGSLLQECLHVKLFWELLHKMISLNKMISRLR